MSKKENENEYVYNMNELVASIKEDQKEKSISDGLSFVLDSGATKNIMSAYVCEKYGIKVKKLEYTKTMSTADNASLNIYGTCRIKFPITKLNGSKQKNIELEIFVSYDLPMKHSYLSLSVLEDMGFY